jgi:Zn finger protein HypA/HybF involved in hydrogenase expression
MLINHQSYSYQCKGCGRPATLDLPGRRKCPTCGKLKLKATGHARLVIGDIEVNGVSLSALNQALGGLLAPPSATPK